MSPFYPFKGGGGLPKGDNVTFFFTVFFISGLPLVEFFKKLAEILSEMGGTYF